MASGRRKRSRKKAPKADVSTAASVDRGATRPSGSPGAWMPLACAVALLALSSLDRVQQSETLARSFWAAAAFLAVWHGVLFTRLRRAEHSRALEIQLRPQHYIQAAVQLAVYAYWGYYWRPVYEFAWLLAAQIVFAYAFDMLLSWSRRDTYVLGFGPFPILFSTNLFLWFKDDWFYLQFVMVAVGFMGKEYVRWNRDGRRVHIFNPSAFSLALFSLVLLSTGATNVTWGQEIASTLTLAPKIYLYLFLVGLVVMYFFSITLVAGSAAIVLFGSSALYSAVTGVPYFIDSEIPAAVFLGLHLLVTDPSTSPRTALGKFLFGMLYGLGVFGLYAVLGVVGAPTFYDKLLCVPLLNLSVQWIDRLAGALQRRVGALSTPALGTGRANLAFMAVWAVFFLTMASVGATDRTHRGDRIPFWEQACEEERRNACDTLLQLEASYCGDNSGWACNELGRHLVEGKVTTPDVELAMGYFSRACEARFQPGCVNLLVPERLARTDPRPLDLRLLLREGGTNLMDMSEVELYSRACEHGWAFACRGAPSASAHGGSEL